MTSERPRVVDRLHTAADRWSLRVSLGFPWSTVSGWLVVRNFAAMPKLLKLLTASGIAIVLVPITMTFRPTRVSGREVAPAEWWSSGAGPLVAVACAFIATAAFLVLRRSRLGRPLFVLAALAQVALVPLGLRIAGAHDAVPVPWLLLHLVLVALLGLYLSKSGAVRKYFRGSPETSG
jgi:hypothetical protein